MLVGHRDDTTVRGAGHHGTALLPKLSLPTVSGIERLVPQTNSRHLLYASAPRRSHDAQVRVSHFAIFSYECLTCHWIFSILPLFLLLRSTLRTSLTTLRFPGRTTISPFHLRLLTLRQTQTHLSPMRFGHHSILRLSLFRYCGCCPSQPAQTRNQPPHLRRLVRAVLEADSRNGIVCFESEACSGN